MQHKHHRRRKHRSKGRKADKPQRKVAQGRGHAHVPPGGASQRRQTPGKNPAPPSVAIPDVRRRAALFAKALAVSTRSLITSRDFWSAVKLVLELIATLLRLAGG
ncbi:hypothetical protein ACIA8O_28485 [Kitasatospora sp. NPDC051853]|uniref:hypothetical protein n=1 Tax=Kitasatospora sp. NPDC051853 TaxID=3364058 RepID=UPI00379C07C0